MGDTEEDSVVILRSDARKLGSSAKSPKSWPLRRAFKGSMSISLP